MKMYMGICQEHGIVITDEEALNYALEQIKHGTPKEKLEFLEWYYSGNFVKGDDRFEQ